jgi:general secretion pathway protein G
LIRGALGRNRPNEVLVMQLLKTVQQLKSQRRRGLRAGFSLAELMVVIVIIGLLATMVVPKLFDSFGDAQLTKAKADLTVIDSAILRYATQNKGNYPDSLEQLVTLDENGQTYLDRTTVPKDPWNNEYIYYPPRGSESSPTLMSYGKDGTQGGEGKDRDITIQMIKNQEI